MNEAATRFPATHRAMTGIFLAMETPFYSQEEIPFPPMLEIPARTAAALLGGHIFTPFINTHRAISSLTHCT